MRFYLIYALLFCFLATYGQNNNRRRVVESGGLTCDSIGAFFQLYHNNNLTDDKGNTTWTGTLAYDNADPVEGSHFGDYNSSGRESHTTSAVDMGDTLTFDFWYRCSGGFKTLLHNYDGSNGFIFDVSHDADDYQFTCIGTGGSNHGYALNASIPSSGWVHIVLTIDVPNGEIAIYQNGVDVTTDSDIRTDLETDHALYISDWNTLYGDIDALSGSKWLYKASHIADSYANAGDEQYLLYNCVE